MLRYVTNSEVKMGEEKKCETCGAVEAPLFICSGVCQKSFAKMNNERNRYVEGVTRKSIYQKLIYVPIGFAFFLMMGLCFVYILLGLGLFEVPSFMEHASYEKVVFSVLVLSGLTFLTIDSIKDSYSRKMREAWEKKHPKYVAASQNLRNINLALKMAEDVSVR